MDMLLQLVSPLVMVLGTAYFALITVFNPLQDGLSGLTTATILGILTSQLILLGVIVGHSIARRSARDLDLIPGIYLYWALELGAVVSVLAALALRRPPRWRVTRKREVPAADPDRHFREPIPLALLVNAYIPDVLAGNGSDVRWEPSGPGSVVPMAGAIREDDPSMVPHPRL